MTIRQTEYDQIILHIFFNHYSPGDTEVLWERSEIPIAANAVGVDRPSNLGDVVYTYRSYRRDLPDDIKDKAPPGMEWIILSSGPAVYKFVPSKIGRISPRIGLSSTKVPDSTPGIIEKYAMSPLKKGCKIESLCRDGCLNY